TIWRRRDMWRIASPSCATASSSRLGPRRGSMIVRTAIMGASCGPLCRLLPRPPQLKLLGNDPADPRHWYRRHHLAVRAPDPMALDLAADVGCPFTARRADVRFFRTEEHHVSAELLRHEISGETPIVPENVVQLGKAGVVEARVALTAQNLERIAERIIPQ